MTTVVLIAVLVISLLFSFPLPVQAAQVEVPGKEGLVYFAGGCFWGVEHMMQQVPGVIEAQSGYANGTLVDPSYQQVVRGDTGHRETVRVRFNPELVTLSELVDLFFSAIDPTIKNRQGNDVGTQYQTGIYFTNDEDGAVIQEKAKQEAAKYPDFEVEILPLTAFYLAEDYHQDYLVKNPGGYCHLGADDFERARNTGKSAVNKQAEYHFITPEDAKKVMDSGEAFVLVDVREPFEFEAGHIKGAINLPLGDLVNLAKEHLQDKDALILLYCRSGARSRSGAMELVKEGYTNLYDLGGTINWPYEVVK